MRRRLGIQSVDDDCRNTVQTVRGLLSSGKVTWRHIASAIGILLFLYLGWSAVFGGGVAAHVKIKNGEIRGTVMTSRGGRRFLAFRGIPYAAPPVGDLRFKDPIPPKNWRGVLEASRDPAMCFQNLLIFKYDTEIIMGQEDCLYLNVYVPETLSSNQENKLDVLVWVHGGAFVLGTGGSYFYGPHYLMDKDVVLVTINYRLGPLGFLSTGDDVVPGNFGMKDQVMALKWVQENIAHFGGNKNSVTIFGQSAGGMSTHLLVLSPLTKGLFHRAISQSGTALSVAAVDRNPLKSTKKLCEILQCPTGNSAEILECLKKQNARDIINTRSHFKEWYGHPLKIFTPVIEAESVGNNRFLHKEPRILLETGEYNHVPWITGLVTAEGCLKTAGLISNEVHFTDFRDNFDRIAPILLSYKESRVSKQITDRIKEFYFNNNPISQDSKENITNMFSDCYFVPDTAESVRLQAASSSAPVYEYLFDFRGKYSYSDILGGTGDFGVCHSDETIYMFTQKLLFSQFRKSDVESTIIDMFLQLWVDFAKTGNPTPSSDSAAVPFKWLKVSPNETNYLQINLRPKMGQNLYKERVDFWKSLATQYF